MRIHKGNKRIAKKLCPHSFKEPNISLFKWALSVKKGDYIGTCEGCNRKVKDIVVYSISTPTHRVHVVDEVEFEDTRGRTHYCPGGGCAYPAETPEEVTNFFRELTFDPKAEETLKNWFGPKSKYLDQAIERHRRMKAALEAGAPIVDEYGELLPEYDRNN